MNTESMMQIAAAWQPYDAALAKVTASYLGLQVATAQQAFEKQTSHPFLTLVSLCMSAPSALAFGPVRIMPCV